MSNRTSLVLGFLILGAFLADALLNNGTATLFLARKFSGLVEWAAFWR